MTKPDRTFVTAADTGDRAAASANGSRSRSRTTAWSARSTARRPAARRVRWYIDPIDGTHNFIRGVPLFGTLLAVEVDGELQARRALGAGAPRALVRPARRGSVGGRGRRDGGAARPSTSRGSRRSPTPSSSTAPGTTSRRPAGRPGSGRCSARSGASAASATSGATRCSPRAPPRRWSRSDLSAWDAAAPLVLIEEAGGRVTDFEGARRIDSRTLLASNGLLHDEVLRRLRG